MRIFLCVLSLAALLILDAPAPACDPSLAFAPASYGASYSYSSYSSGFAPSYYGGLGAPLRTAAYYDPAFAYRQEVAFRGNAFAPVYSRGFGVGVGFHSPAVIVGGRNRVVVFP